MVLEGKLFLSLQVERWSVSTSPSLLRGAQRDLGHLQPHGRQWPWGRPWGKAQELLALATLQFCTNTIFQIHTLGRDVAPQLSLGGHRWQNHARGSSLSHSLLALCGWFLCPCLSQRE